MDKILKNQAKLDSIKPPLKYNVEASEY